MLNDRERFLPTLAALCLSASAAVLVLVLPAFVPPSFAQSPRTMGQGPSGSAEMPCPPDQLLAGTAWPEPIPLPWQRWRRIMALGKCHLAAGDVGLAASLFQQGGAEAPEFEPVWRLNLLRAWIAAGAVNEAAALIGQLLGAPQSAAGNAPPAAKDEQPGVREAVRAALSEALARGLPEAAQSAYLTAYLNAAEPQADDYDLVLALHLQTGGAPTPNGRPWRFHLWRGPKDERAADTWRGVSAELSAAGVGPAPDDYLARARQLRRLRAFGLLREEFAPAAFGAALAVWPPDKARALGQIWFAALARTRHFTLALNALRDEAALRAFAFEPRDSVTLAVEFHLKAGEPSTAQERLSELELLDPKAYILPGYYLDFARRARLRGDLPGLVQWCRRTLERFPDHPRAAEAFWLLVWEHYRQGLPEETARWAEAFLTSPSSVSGRERFHYWLGRAYTQLGRGDDALRAWAPLLSPARTDFYSLLAQGESLDQLAVAAPPNGAAGQAAASHELQPGAPELVEIWSQRELMRPVFLLMLGEPALAEPALEQALAAPASPALLRELAAALTRLRIYHLAQKVAVRHFRPNADAQAGPDPDALRLIYPLAYWEQVNGRSREALNPFFVLAVIREESHFRTDADSTAGAKGLMQLMPNTAAALARDHGLPEEEEALLEPHHNIALGTLYLERLSKRFGGNALHIAAGYNAGPTVVSKWLRSMSTLPADEFIESIPYDETQNYVKKVLATSILYRRLYRTQ